MYSQMSRYKKHTTCAGMLGNTIYMYIIHTRLHNIIHLYLIVIRYIYLFIQVNEHIKSSLMYTIVCVRYSSISQICS